MAQKNSRKIKKKPKEEEEVVESSESENEEKRASEEEESESNGDDDSNSDESDSSDDDVEEDDEQDLNALFKGESASDDKKTTEEGSESGSDDDEVDNSAAANIVAANIAASSSEHCTFDLRNMIAVNSHQIAPGKLYNSKKSNSDDYIAIPLDKAQGLDVDEDFLLSQATKGCTELIQAIWQLPTEMSDAGPLVHLPSHDEIRLPRAMPPPPPKEETKWEKFAKQKGIPLNKEKRSRKVWDEVTGGWMYRHGYEKANSKSKEWPIMEVGANDDPFEDPWEKLREAKRSRTEKNLESRMKNQERAGNLAKGETNRIIKSRENSRNAGKSGGEKDRVNVPPSGIPVDMKNGAKRGKVSTNVALEAVQRSTASMGKFDKLREGEPERKKVLSKMKKRKYELATDKKVINSEGEKSMKILKSVMNGGGVEKEKAIRKGKLAKGETAYDYDYDDGLGASSFKKKKGRAGAGKMKKMTKKRAK